MNTIPKTQLVKLIMDSFPDGQTRHHFHIKADTDIHSRLMDMKRAQLTDYINELAQNPENMLQPLQARFPLRATPSMYIVRALGQPQLHERINEMNRLAESGRASGLELPDSNPIRMIYIVGPLQQVLDEPIVHQLAIAYERRIDYIDGDPDSNSYGEPVTAWSLENVLLWFSDERVSGGIIGCNYAPAARSVLQLLRQSLGVNCSVPDLSDSMFSKIVGTSMPRSATFSVEGRPQVDTDVRTLTLYDPHLSETALYRNLKAEASRRQTTGYYVRHEAVLTGGIGVTKRYGRVWTPVHLDQVGLARMAIELLIRTNDELEKLKRDQPETLIALHNSHPVFIGKRQLKGRIRDIFDYLVQSIIHANRTDSPVPISDHIRDLIECANALSLESSLLFECDQCGDHMVFCPNCAIPLAPVLDNGLHAKCPNCQFSKDFTTEYQCDCLATQDVIEPINHVVLAPADALIDSIESYLHLLGIDVSPLFLISGGQLTVQRVRHAAVPQTLTLADLQLWRVRGHIHTHEVSEAKEGDLARLATRLREKCVPHPTIECCARCVESLPHQEILRTADLCLLRVFGIPIDMRFDGIHHGHEGADIAYEDRLEDQTVRVGIHVKSIRGSLKWPRFLTRTSGQIRGLYTQLYYSLYLACSARLPFDVLGVAIPDGIDDSVKQSMQGVASRFGFPLLIVDYEDWVRIIDLALEVLPSE